MHLRAAAAAALLTAALAASLLVGGAPERRTAAQAAPPGPAAVPTAPTKAVRDRAVRTARSVLTTRPQPVRASAHDRFQPRDVVVDPDGTQRRLARIPVLYPGEPSTRPVVVWAPPQAADDRQDRP